MAAVCGAAFGDHLIEPSIEARQCVGDAIRLARVCGRRSGRLGRSLHCGDWRCALHDRRRLRKASLRQAFELARQVVETVMNRREVIIDAFVVDMVTI